MKFDHFSARDDFNHGVVLTNRKLKPNELFEVVLDRVIPKWAGNFYYYNARLIMDQVKY